jgi:cytochrome bd-type quinol oxidase subunit 2
LNNLFFARSQMGMSLAFYIVFAVIGMAMPLLMVVSEGCYLWTKKPIFLELSKRWAAGAAILFAVGAVSGTVLSFELGLLWPKFMQYAGGIIGMPFSLEGFAFFTEAIFLEIYLYGWNRVSPVLHWLAGIVVVVSGVLSAVFVLANSWMNAPTGFDVVSGIHVVEDHVTTGFFAGWLTPFALACGLFALALFAFLAATYMTVDIQGQPDLQNDFRLRAIWAETALIPLAIIVFITSKYGAALMYRGLTNWWAPLLLGWTALSALTAALALWSRRFYLARIAAVAQVTFILLGWGLAQFPHLVTPDVTLQNAAAPESTLKLLPLALGAGAAVLLPSLIYLFQIFNGQEER